MSDVPPKTSVLSRRLDALDDQLADYITKIELALRDYFSIRVWTKFNDDTRLEFGKHRGAWQLILVNNGTSTALLSSPRNIRQEVLSGGHIERLVLEGAQQLDMQITEREFALKEAERILAALERART